jgi:hypothetical protein
VSSSTDNIKRLRIPAPRVDLLRAAASNSGGNTSRSVKPAGLNSLELIIIATGICEESTFSVGSHSSKCETRRVLIHTVQPPLDHESKLAIVEARTLVILPLAGLQFELILAVCFITRISKLTEPVMTGPDASVSPRWSTYIWNTFMYMCIYVHIYM